MKQPLQIRAIKKLATMKSMPYQTLIRHWLAEGGQERIGIGREIVVSLKIVPQSQINHIVLTVLAKEGVLGAVKEHIAGSNLPVVADLVFCEDLGR